MTFHVSNESGADVCLYIGRKQHLIKSEESNVIESDNESCSLLVRRAVTLPLPDYKKMFLADFLGILAILFIKPIFYYFDVSAEYRISGDKGNANIRIVRIKKGNPSGYYDAICIKSPELALSDVTYRTENKTAILQMYKKCKKASRFWTYFLLELLFLIAGMAISYPLLITMYLQSKAMTLIILMVLIAISIVFAVTLIGILPLHFIFKYTDKSFFRAMEHKDIIGYLRDDDSLHIMGK